MQSKGAGGTPAVVAEIVAGGLLVVAMIFGGGSRGAGDLVVHLVALPALVLGIVRWRHTDAGRLQRLFLIWLIAAVVVIGLQLLSLPVSIFAAMPGRASVLAELRAAGLDPAWLPMTLDRWGTVRALLSLVSFAAMWLLASTLDRAAHARLLKLAVAVAVLLALLGFAQAAAGHEPTLRFYEFHNTFGASATFANRNHFASLLAMAIPFAIVAGHQAQQSRRPGAVLGWYGSAVLLLLAAALTFSRAGVVLATLAAGATVLLLLRQDGAADAPRRRGARRSLLIWAVIAGAAVANYAWSGIADRFDQDPVADLRLQYVQYGVQAVAAYLPWGSGLGSFSAAYAPFEPVAAMTNVYALHAHNDLVELAVEAGIPGLILLLALLGLLVAGVRKALTDRTSPDAIMLAVLIAVLVPLAHSLVDYPLRTLAVAILFALVLAQLSYAPPPNQKPGRRDVLT